MPIADAKVEKQASPEAAEPIKQAITIIEHKVRNLEKRKRKIEIYREDQKNGQTLNVDQLLAVSKYGEVSKTLDFAHELCKQFSVLALETNKQAKKHARKEMIERAAQEIAKIREILLVQDILQNMGHDSVREDFLAGRKGAVQLSETDLKHLDDLYVEVSPKRVVNEEGVPTFMEQVASASEHLLSLVDGKAKEVVGTTHEYLHSLINKIQGSGYFDLNVPQSSEDVIQETISLDAGATVAEQVEEVIPEPESAIPELPSCIDLKESMAQTVIPSAPLAASLPIPSNLVSPPKAMMVAAVGMPSPPMAVAVNSSYFSTETANNFIAHMPHQTVSELIQQTVGGSFNFLQDSELDAEVSMSPPSVAVSQTYAKQNPSVASTASVAPPQQAPVFPVDQAFPGTTSHPPPPIPMPPSHQISTGPYQVPQPTDYHQEPKLQAPVDVIRNKSDSWALSDPNDQANDVASEWIQPAEHSSEWTQDQGPRDWVQQMAEENAATFAPQNASRPYSGSSGGSSGNRSNNRTGRPTGGVATGAARNTNYANPRSGPRPGGNYHNGNRTNYNSYAPPPRTADSTGNSGALGNSTGGGGGYYQQQNGYQQRDTFQSNGNYGGQGQHFRQPRPSRDRGPPCSRGGSSRGGLRASPHSAGADASMNPRNNQRGGGGGSYVPQRTQSNRQ